jgi:mannitol-specific phosphotransferase system IIBC component
MAHGHPSEVRMHTLKVLAIGFLLLGLSLLGGRLIQGSRGIAIGALVFLPLWLIGASINMYIGVKRAGYTPAQERPLFLIVFLVPAIPALFTWWKLH